MVLTGPGCNTSKEIISVELGQAGLQVGNAFWELICLEHGIQVDGDMNIEKDVNNKAESLFYQCESGKWVPRCLMFDMEPSVADEIRSGSYRSLFNPSFILSGKEDSASLFARSYYSHGKEYINLIMDNIRRLANKCDNLCAFELVNSYSGGTGSGMSALILEHLSADYGKKFRFTLSVFPSPRFSQIMVDPYNTLMHIGASMESTDCSVICDNETLYEKCVNNLGIGSPSFTLINRIFSQVSSNIFLSHRYNYYLSQNASVVEILTNLVPYPRIHFPVAALAPFCTSDQLEHERYDTDYLTDSCFLMESQACQCDIYNNKYMSCAMLYRGDVNLYRVYESISKVKANRKVNFVDWCPTGFKLAVNLSPPLAVPGCEFKMPGRSLVMIAGNTGIKEAWGRLGLKFDLLISKRAFIHHYVSEGMEEDEFFDCRENIACLEKDYTEVASELNVHSTTDSVDQPGYPPDLMTPKQSSQVPSPGGPLVNSPPANTPPIAHNVSPRSGSERVQSGRSNQQSFKKSPSQARTPSAATSPRQSNRGNSYFQRISPQSSVKVNAMPTMPSKEWKSFEPHQPSRGYSKEGIRSPLTTANPTVQKYGVQQHYVTYDTAESQRNSQLMGLTQTTSNSHVIPVRILESNPQLKPMPALSYQRTDRVDDTGSSFKLAENVTFHQSLKSQNSESFGKDNNSNNPVMSGGHHDNTLHGTTTSNTAGSSTIPNQSAHSVNLSNSFVNETAAKMPFQRNLELQSVPDLLENAYLGTVQDQLTASASAAADAAVAAAANASPIMNRNTHFYNLGHTNRSALTVTEDFSCPSHDITEHMLSNAESEITSSTSLSGLNPLQHDFDQVRTNESYGYERKKSQILETNALQSGFEKFSNETIFDDPQFQVSQDRDCSQQGFVESCSLDNNSDLSGNPVTIPGYQLNFSNRQEALNFLRIIAESGSKTSSSVKESSPSQISQQNVIPTNNKHYRQDEMTEGDITTDVAFSNPNSNNRRMDICQTYDDNCDANLSCRNKKCTPRYASKNSIDRIDSIVDYNNNRLQSSTTSNVDSQSRYRYSDNRSFSKKSSCDSFESITACSSITRNSKPKRTSKYSAAEREKHLRDEVSNSCTTSEKVRQGLKKKVVFT